MDDEPTVTLYMNEDKSNFVILVDKGFVSSYVFYDVKDVALADLSYGGRCIPSECLESYIEHIEKDGLEKQWSIQVSNFNYIYNIVCDWVRDGEFDIYNYYGERPWHLGGEE